MALGEYRPPNQINKDEDKYGKGQLAFTKVQILYAAVGLLLGFLVFSFFRLFHMAFFNILGFVIMIFLVAFGIFIGGFTITEKNYLNGGGLRYDMYLKRKLIKKYDKRKHVIYTNNINRGKNVSYSETLNNNNNSSIFDLLMKNSNGEEETK